MIKITKQFLKSKEACVDGYEFYLTCNTTDAETFIKNLIKIDRLDWLSWLLVRMMNKNQCVMYALYSAKQVLHIYEEKYPDDKRPRLAIETAKDYLKNPCDETKDAADAAAYAADAAAYAASDAAYAAYAAAAAADAAAYAAANAAYAADDAAAYSADAADAADDLKLKICKYGIKLLRGK